MEEIDNHKDSASYKKELTTIATGASLSFSGKILGGIIQFLFYVIAARILGVHQFGLLMLGITIIEIVSLIGRAGMEGAAVKFVALHNSVGDTAKTKGVIVSVLKYALLCSTLLAVILFLIPETVYGQFGKQELFPVIRLLAIAVPFSAITTVGLNITQGFKTMRYTVYTQNMFMPVANLVIFLLLFAFGIKLYGAVIAFDLTIILAAIITIIFVCRIFPSITGTKALTNDREIFQFGIKFLSIMFLILVLLWTDILMLGFLKSSKDVGIYSVAAKAALFLNTILLSLSHIFSPVISGLYNTGQTKKLGDLFKVVTKWSFSISLPVLLFIVLMAKEVMGLLGQDFSSGYLCLIILTFVQFVNAGTGPVTHMLIMSGHENIMVIISVLACIINIGLNLLLIPLYGIFGAALASGVSVVFFNLAMLITTYVLLKIHPYSTKYLKSLLISVFIFGIMLVIKYFIDGFLSQFKGIIQVGSYALLFAILYIIFIYITGFDKEDGIILEVIKNKFAPFKAKK